MKQLYKKWMPLFQMHPEYVSIITITNKILTFTAFILYPVLIGSMLLQMDKRTTAFVFVPAFSFVAMSIIRRLFHSRRPYEIYDFQPVIPRKKNGDSFPSRHVFSIFLIATLWFDIWKPTGIFLFLSGFILALIRVIGGVHFLKDVICGAVTGIFCGLLTLFICTL